MVSLSPSERMSNQFKKSALDHPDTKTTFKGTIPFGWVSCAAQTKQGEEKALDIQSTGQIENASHYLRLAKALKTWMSEAAEHRPGFRAALASFPSSVRKVKCLFSCDRNCPCSVPCTPSLKFYVQKQNNSPHSSIDIFIICTLFHHTVSWINCLPLGLLLWCSLPVFFISYYAFPTFSSLLLHCFDPSSHPLIGFAPHSLVGPLPLNKHPTVPPLSLTAVGSPFRRLPNQQPKWR